MHGNEWMGINKRMEMNKWKWMNGNEWMEMNKKESMK